jgi:superfamily II DNA/RNA helicase
MGFQSEMRVLMAAVPAQRQTLLFSATMTDNLAQLESLAMTNPIKYDLTKRATLPATLTQQYLFMPAQVSATVTAVIATLPAMLLPVAQ